MTHSVPETNDQEYTPQPMPDWMKYGGMALLALVVFIMIWLFSSSGDDKPEKVPASVAVESDGSLLKQQLTTPAAAIPAKTQGVYNESALPEVPRDDQIQPLKAQISQLKRQITQMQQDFKADQKRQDEAFSTLKQWVESMKQELTDLKNQRISSPQKIVAVKKKRTYKKYRKPVSLPFTLVSIDQWGQELYAVLRFQGHLIDVSVGQQLSGWTITGINREQGKVFLKGSRGRIKSLTTK